MNTVPETKFLEGVSLKSLSVTVTAGQIAVNHITLIVDREDAKVIDIDCYSNAEAMSCSGNDADGLMFIEIMLYATDETLHATDATRPTIIRFAGLRNGWLSEIAWSKHTGFFLYLWRWDGQGAPLWTKEVAA